LLYNSHQIRVIRISGGKLHVPPRIIVADPDQGFGLMLAQLLETDRAFVADYVSSGSQALTLARDKHPQLVIIDAALGDMTPPALIRALRQMWPALRIMVIPFTNSLPQEYAELNLQGTLPKPFFAGDLGMWIGRALEAEVTPTVEPLSIAYPQPDLAATKGRDGLSVGPDVKEAIIGDQAGDGHFSIIETRVAAPPRTARLSAPQSPGSAAPRVRQSTAPSRTGTQSPAARVLPGVSQVDSGPSGIEEALNALANEISADALFVIQEGTIIAQRSTLSELRQESLSDLLAGWFDVASGLASFVEERGRRFKQLHFEGDRYHVYGFCIDEAAVLVAISHTDIPLGNLRLSIKGASAEIAKYLH
jgi:CheY-like chemotaxis protein